MADSQSIAYTTSGPPEIDTEGFVKTLYIYWRGPNSPPGNQWIWTCELCLQLKADGHLPDCPRVPEDATGALEAAGELPARGVAERDAARAQETT